MLKFRKRLVVSSLLCVLLLLFIPGTILPQYYHYHQHGYGSDLGMQMLMGLDLGMRSAQRWEALRLQQEYLHMMKEDLYRKGYEAGYKDALENATKMVEENLPKTLVSYLQDMSSALMAITSKEELIRAKKDFEHKLSQYPEDSFIQLSLFVINHRLQTFKSLDKQAEKAQKNF